MTLFGDYGSPQLGLNDLKIATWNSTDDYATEVDVPSAEMLGVTLTNISDQLEGDDKITATGSRAIGGEVRIRFGSLSVEALEVMVGNASAESGASPNQQTVLKISGGDNMPYFGLVGKALAEEGSGDTHVFLAKAKIMGDVEVAGMEYGRFIRTEMTVRCVDDDTYGIMQAILHETAAAVAVPPVGAV